MLIEIIIMAVIGLLAGGVVNALSDDLPLRRSPRLPRYIPDEKKRAIHIYNDEEKIKAILSQPEEKRPIIAWLGLTAFLTGNRISPNGVKLSWRYPIAELFTAALMILLVLSVNNDNSLSTMSIVQFTIWTIYMAIFALITIIDIEHKLILFVVIVPSVILALIDASLTTFLGNGFILPTIRDALFGGAMGFTVFFVMYNGGFLFTYVMGKIRGQEITEVAFGYGDVMLATLSGIILGWRSLIFAMSVTVLLGALGALIYLISRRLLGEKYSAFTAIPYGPYIVAGTILMLLYRASVIDFFY